MRDKTIGGKLTKQCSEVCLFTSRPGTLLGYLADAGDVFLSQTSELIWLRRAGMGGGWLA